MRKVVLSIIGLGYITGLYYLYMIMQHLPRDLNPKEENKVIIIIVLSIVMLVKYVIQLVLTIRTLRERMPNSLTRIILKLVNSIYYQPLKTLEERWIRPLPGFKEILISGITITEEYISVKSINKFRILPKLILVVIFICESQYHYILNHYYNFLFLILISIAVPAIIYVVDIYLSNKIEELHDKYNIIGEVNEEGTQLTINSNLEVSPKVLSNWGHYYQLRNYLAGINMENNVNKKYIHANILILMYYIVGWISILGINLVKVI